MVEDNVCRPRNPNGSSRCSLSEHVRSVQIREVSCTPEVLCSESTRVVLTQPELGTHLPDLNNRDADLGGRGRKSVEWRWQSAASCVVQLYEGSTPRSFWCSLPPRPAPISAWALVPSAWLGAGYFAFVFCCGFDGLTAQWFGSSFFCRPQGRVQGSGLNLRRTCTCTLGTAHWGCTHPWRAP